MSTMRQLAGRTAGAWALAMGVCVVGAVHAYAQEGAEESPTTLAVQNARGVPVVVYLERGVFDTRLGTVAPHGEEELPLPPRLADGEKFFVMVHPEGGFDLRTRDALVVRRGEALHLYVPTSNDGFVPPPAPEAIPNPGFEGATLTVENPSDRTVVAFIERGEFDTRIGTVRPGDSRTFELPEALAERAGSVDVFLHVEGGADLASTTFELAPRAHLLVKVPS